MNPSPLPQPSAHTCPNCGAPIDGQQQNCLRCGETLGESVALGRSLKVIFAQIFLVLVTIILTLVGTFTIAVGARLWVNSRFHSLALSTLATGAVFLYCAWAFLRGIIRLSKR